MPRALQPFSNCPLPALAPSSFGWSYARWLRCPMPCARVMGAGLVGEHGNSHPHGAAPAPPGNWLLRPNRDASSYREPTLLLAFATIRKDVGYLLEERLP